MHICIVSPDYPTSKTIDFIFVDQLCRALALKGVDVTVIAPQTLTKCLVRKIPVAKRKQRIYVSEKAYITLLRPKYISTGTWGGIFKGHNGKAYRKAVARAFSWIKTPVDVCYGHFWGAVKAIYPTAKQHHLPLFASSGEEYVGQARIGFMDEEIQEIRDYITGSIHVSTNNKNECRETGLVMEGKACVIPNAIDSKLFYQRDKNECRKKLGIPGDAFVTIFVGQFTDRKGTMRLDAALKQLNDVEIKAIFIGRGPEDPTYEGIITKGPQPHDLLPEFLSAADVFVLPTLNEGCCNAVIEALACGLPVISSDCPFNYDVLDESNSLLIAPENVESIADAIKKVKNDEEMRRNLSNGALAKAKDLTLSQRVEKILSFIEKMIKS